MSSTTDNAHSLLTRLRIARHINDSLNELDALTNKHFSLVPEDEIVATEPCVKTTSLKLLQKAQVLAQENPTEFCRFFRTSRNVAFAFANTKKLHRLSILSVLPFHPHHSEEEISESLSCRDWPLSAQPVHPSQSFFQLNYWLFAQQLAVSDLLSCTAVTGLPLSVANLLAVSQFEQIWEFCTKHAQTFCFNIGSNSLIELLDSERANMLAPPPRGW